ncbi:MAG: HD domain-containing phosphohydrolase [Rhizobium sp.]
MTLQAELRRVIYALSDALDLVGVDDVAHGKRVGVMAAECGKALGLPIAETTFLFDLGMLHDIGVSSTMTHRNLVGEFDWDGAQLHAETGYNTVRDFPPLARMALPIRYHHTHWDKLAALALEPSVTRAANLIFLVDRVDALAAPYFRNNTVLMHTAEIRERIQHLSGSYFAPELVQAFLDASQAVAFWLQLEPRSIQSYLREALNQGEIYRASIAELKQLAEIFSRIVDAKSPFTAEHSLGVARLARFIAEKMGVSEINCDKLEIAGLLHDLGKLRVPDEILDKPGKLDPRERLIINTHSYETFQILHGIEGFEEITPWAAYHHEEPGGRGYPFRLHAEDLPLEARILRVADIFQALAQDRPYRTGLTAEEVLPLLDDFVANGRVDADIVAIVRVHLDEAIYAARPALRHS